MNVSFNGLGAVCATFEAGEGAAAGIPVKISADGTVAACADGDVPAGVCEKVRGGYAAVQVKGYVTVAYTGALALGAAAIAADGEGRVKPAEAEGKGRDVFVLDMDASAGTAGILL